MRRSYGRRPSFRRKSSWVWADSGLVLMTNALGTVVSGRRYTAELILPPGRVKWLCDNTIRRSHLTVTGVLLWLDWRWIMNTNAVLPDVDFWVDSTQEDDDGNISFVRDAYFEPQVPAAMAAWTDAASDGLDGFMWTHRIYGITPPNAVPMDNPSSDMKGNQAVNAPGGDTDHAAIVCRKFSVAAEWQPDVHIRTKRRLRQDEGLVLGMSALDAQVGAGVSLQLRWNVRIVGR